MAKTGTRMAVATAVIRLLASAHAAYLLSGKVWRQVGPVSAGGVVVEASLRWLLTFGGRSGSVVIGAVVICSRVRKSSSSDVLDDNLARGEIVELLAS
jgi:hypothetical protein